MTAVAAATTVEEIVALTLHTARTPLGFDRALWLEIEPAQVVVEKFAIDGSDVVERRDEVHDYESTSGLSSLINGTREVQSGFASELGAPMVDVRHWYAIVSVFRAGGKPATAPATVAIVYVDGHISPHARSWELQLLQSIVAIAAIALQNVALLEEAQTLANRDPLTGLFNRRAFNDRLAQHLRSTMAQASFVLAMIDVDDFKAINDLRGHATGDAVLKRLARTLLASSRVDDVVGRFAGDEFVVILSSVAEGDADAMVARLSTDLRSAGISCSIGGARYPKDGCDSDSLFVAADRALYVAKAAGKNRHAMA